ncbi:MAG TPA: glycosyltransferase family 39 protein [bacterium]|nr:glycosyltransferase family 39 protein [bacterium]
MARVPPLAPAASAARTLTDACSVSRRWAQTLSANPLIALGGILVLAAGLRFSLLGQRSLWSDEMFVVWLVRFKWEAMFSTIRTVDFHPPLYYALMKVWVGLTGVGEAPLRIPSACSSLVSVGLTYALMRKVSSPSISLLSAFAVAVSPFGIMAGQEARMYPLLGVFVLASTLALVVSIERGTVFRWGTYVLFAVLMAYTHYFGFLVLLAHGCWVGGWKRPQLRAWLASIGVTVLSYIPWIPSLWYQVAGSQGLSAAPASWASPVDLLGLFAFGGSLFGTAGYFSASSLSLLERLIVILPFLVILWRGAMSLRSDRSGLALLALPPVVTIGVAFAFSLAKPVFLPRWFSFLVPFYAMFLAQGTFDVAEQVDAQPRQALALFTAALLLYSVPVLDRYYFDPTARPFRWRAAASLVRGLVEPGDFFVYVDTPAEQTFTYYLREPHPSVTLVPIGRSLRDPSTIPNLVARYRRVWLIVNGPMSAIMRQRIFASLASTFRITGHRNLSGAEVYLFDRQPLPPHEGSKVGSDR